MLLRRRRLGLATIVVAALGIASVLAVAAWGAEAKKPPISVNHARHMKADIEAAINREQAALDSPDSFSASVRASETWLRRAMRLGKGVDTGGARRQAYRAVQLDNDALNGAPGNKELRVRQALDSKRQAVKDLALFLNPS